MNDHAQHLDDDGLKSESSHRLNVNSNPAAYCQVIPYFYDQSKPPTFIEYLFGEPYHVSDDYPSHQITWRLILTLLLESIVTGSILWLQIAVRYYLISIWSVGPSQFTIILCVIQIPFTIRIFYGLLIDSVPLFEYRRKSYLFLFGFIAVVASFGLIFYNHSFTIQIFCLCIRSFAIAFCDVIISAITVQRSEFKPHAVAIRLQSLNYFSMYVVSAIGLIWAAKIEESQNPHDIIYVYWMYFAVTFLILIGAILLPEQSGEVSRHKKHRNELEKTANLAREENVRYNMLSNDEHKQDEHDFTENVSLFESHDVLDVLNDHPQYTVLQVLSLTLETFCRKIVFYPLLFTFLLAAMPRSKQAMDYYLMYQLGFDSNQIGYLQIVSSIAFLVSVVIITVYSKLPTFSLRSLFGIWTFVAAIIPYSSLVLIFGVNRVLLITDFVYAAVDTVMVRITVDVLLLGTAILYARICPPGIEGVFFTLLTSVATIGEVISYAVSALFINIFDIQCATIQYLDPVYTNPNNPNNIMCDFNNLWLLVIAVNLSTLIPLMWIFWIPDEEEMRQIAMTLRQSAAHQLMPNDNDDDDGCGYNQHHIKEDDMISLYFVCVDYVVPFLKQYICCNINQKNDECHACNESPQYM